MRKGAIALLQARLSDALDLEAHMKQAHWNVRGPNFVQLHQLFDSVHGEVEAFVDLVAARISTLGGVPDSRVQTTAETSSLYEYALETRAGEEHLKAVAAVLAQFGKALRADIDRAAEIGDADTADVFTEVSRATDKQLWFVEAHLPPPEAGAPKQKRGGPSRARPFLRAGSWRRLPARSRRRGL